MTVAIEVDLRARLLAVRDQGPRPTCLAHATTVAHEHARGATEPLAPEYLHFFASQQRPWLGCTIPETAQALEVEGQPPELDCPYHPIQPTPAWRPPIGIPVLRYLSEVKPPSVHEVEQWIKSGRVAILSLTMPESFYDPRPPWIIDSSGAIRGRHAVAAVGIGTYKGARSVLIRNSWGDQWGDAGHAWLDESFLTQHLKGLLIPIQEVTP